MRHLILRGSRVPTIKYAICIFINRYVQEFIIKEGRESIQLSQYTVQTYCVKFVL